VKAKKTLADTKQYVVNEVLTSAVEAQAHNYACRVDIVSPQQLKAQLDLGEVCVCICIRTNCCHCAVPYTVLTKNVSFALDQRKGGADLTDVICHNVKPVNMFLQIDDVKPLHVPIRCRLKHS
jgi:hypothetical protein